MTTPFKIRAWKPTEQNSLTVCDLDDPEANQFEIAYYVHGCGFSSNLEFNRVYDAERALSAMTNAYESGRKAAFAELRQLIGVPR